MGIAGRARRSHQSSSSCLQPPPADLLGFTVTMDPLGLLSDFTRAKLDNADPHQANLTAGIFTDARLAGADRRNASLRGAIARQTNLAGATRQGADLTGVYLADAHLTGATIEGAVSLLDTRLAGVTARCPDHLAECVERGARLDAPARVPAWATLVAASHLVSARSTRSVE